MSSACRPLMPSPSHMSAQKEKLSLPESFVDSLPPLFRECARLLEERGKAVIEKETG